MSKVALGTIPEGSQPNLEKSECPEGWVTTSIGNIVELNPRKPPRDALPPEAPVTFVPMPAVDAFYGRIAAPDERPFGAVRKGYTAFRENDVIFAKITPCMENGKSAVVHTLTNALGFGSTEFHVLRSNGAVIPDYLFYYIRQDSFRRGAEAGMTGSVGQKRVPADFIKNAPLPLPPLPEQKRIVAKVEELLARVNVVRERLARVKEILKRFRQSVLSAACSGRLTVDWREKNPHAKPTFEVIKQITRKAKKDITYKGSGISNWGTVKVDELYTSFGGGTPSKNSRSYWGGDIPWVASGDVKNDRIRNGSLFITEEGLRNSSAKICEPGSVIVVVRSGILKHTLPVAIAERELAINQDIKCLVSFKSVYMVTNEPTGYRCGNALRFQVCASSTPPIYFGSTA